MKRQRFDSAIVDFQLHLLSILGADVSLMKSVNRLFKNRNDFDVNIFKISQRAS